jgi:hypothetical protein
MAVSHSRHEDHSFDPPLTPVCAAYPASPFPPFSHPPIELANRGPCGHIHLDRWIDFSAIRFGTPL